MTAFFETSLETPYLYSKLLALTSYRLRHADIKVAPLYPETCQVGIQKSTLVPKKCLSGIGNCLPGNWKLPTWYLKLYYLVLRNCLHSTKKMQTDTWKLITWNPEIANMVPERCLPGIWKLPTWYLEIASQWRQYPGTSKALSGYRVHILSAAFSL